MSSKEKIWIGADPGGQGKFGLAIIYSDGSVETHQVDCADEAIDLIKVQKSEPTGAGVDSPLWWSSGRSSDRLADKWLRKTYHLTGGQVQTANSLKGAVLVQGVIFSFRIREIFPDIGITESHPKALLKGLKIDSWETFSRRFGINMTLRAEQEHERDAIISAVAAREGFERRWSRDLSITRDPSEQDPSKYWLAPVHYFWPDR